MYLGIIWDILVITLIGTTVRSNFLNTNYKRTFFLHVYYNLPNNFHVFSKVNTFTVTILFLTPTLPLPLHPSTSPPPRLPANLKAPAREPISKISLVHQSHPLHTQARAARFNETLAA